MMEREAFPLQGAVVMCDGRRSWHVSTELLNLTLAT